MAEVDINQSYRWLGGIFRQVFSLQGDISPAQITADQDDYNPTGLSTAAILRLSTDATRNINGIAGGADGRIIKIVNVGTQGIVLKDEATTSTAANRFALNSDVTISESQAVELWYDSTSSRWRLFGGTGGTTVVAPDQANGVVSGGTVTWLQNYDYEVSESFYYIDSVLYHSAVTTVTLNAADPTDDRIDLFVLTTSNTADKVTGTASTPPAEPNYDPATQLKISFAFVENGTTQPTITQDWLYRENAGTPGEWAYTDNTANLNPASTNNPYAGTIDIEGTSVAAGDSFTLTDTASPNFTLYDALVFKIRSKAAWTTRVINIQWFNGTTLVGNAVLFGDGSFGFNSSNISTYQNVNIPLSSFGVITGADRVTFRRMTGGGTIGFYIDDIQLMLSGSESSTETDPLSIHLTGTSTLTGNATVATGSLKLTVSTATAAINPFAVTSTSGNAIAATSTTGNALNASATSSGNGITATSASGSGGSFVSTSSTGISAQSTSSIAGQFITNPTSTNTIHEQLRTQRNTQGTAGDGIGHSIAMRNENADGNTNETNTIKSEWTTADAATRIGKLTITGVTDADTHDVLRLAGPQSTLLSRDATTNETAERYSIAGAYKALVEATATAFVRINIPTGTVAGGQILLTVEANDATDFQARTLRFVWSAVNKAGTTTITVGTPEEVVAVSTGTLTVAITATDAGSGNVDFKADASSSLTQTVLRCSYHVFKNIGTGTITPQ